MRKLVALLIIAIALNGCSIQRLAVRSMGGVLEDSMAALYEESDLQLAEQAIAADLKLLEGLLKSDQENNDFLLMASQGFTAYALGFVEDDDPDRARALYIRGRDYGLKLLKQNKAFQGYPFANLDAFQQALQKLSVDDVPALFWTANAWASWINLSFTNPQALADLPRVQMMMRRVLALDESFYYGSAHLFFATIYAARPPLLGGNVKKAQEHFEKCFTFADDTFLLPYVFYAKYYATRLFDESLFDSTITKILDTSLSVLPNQQLPNAIAQEKAKKLKAMKEDLF